MDSNPKGCYHFPMKPEATLSPAAGMSLPPRLRAIDLAAAIACFATLITGWNVALHPEPLWQKFTLVCGMLLVLFCGMQAGYARLMGTPLLLQLIKSAALFAIAGWMSDIFYHQPVWVSSNPLVMLAASLLLTPLAMMLASRLLALLCFLSFTAWLLTPELAPMVRDENLLPLFHFLPYLFLSLLGAVLLKLIAYDPENIFRSPPSLMLALAAGVCGGASAFVLPAYSAPFLILMNVFVLGIACESFASLRATLPLQLAGRIALTLSVLQLILLETFVKSFLTENPQMAWPALALFLFAALLLAFLWDYLTHAYQQSRLKVFGVKA